MSADLISEKLEAAAASLNGGAPADAQNIYAEILREVPDEPVALNGMARIAFTRGRPQTAIMLLDRIGAINELSPPQLYLKAYIHLLSSNAERARSIFQALYSSQTTNVELICNLASAHRFSGDQKNASDLYEKALTINPDHAQPLAGLGWLAFDRIANSRAKTFADRARNASIDHADSDILEACLRYEDGTLGDAADDVFRTYQKAPHDPLCTVFLSAVMVEQGSLIEAEKTLLDLLLNYPDLAAARLLLARIHLERGNMSLAASEAEAATVAAPWSLQVQTSAANLIKLAGINPEREVKARRRPKPTDVSMRLHLVKALTEEGDFLKAAEIVQNLIAEDRGNAEAHHLLAVILTRTGQFQEAETFASKAIELDSQFAEAIAQLGDIFNRQDKYLEADKTARRALKLDPDLAFASHVLGRAAAKLKRHVEAERHYRQAIEIDPEYVDPLAGLTTLFYD